MLQYLALKPEKDESPECLYKRVISYQCLMTGASVTELGHLEVCMAIHVWLGLLHPDLPNVVRIFFQEELKTTSLPDIREKITNGLPLLLSMVRGGETRSSQSSDIKGKEMLYPMYMPVTFGVHQAILMVYPEGNQNLISRPTAKVLYPEVEHVPHQTVTLQCQHGPSTFNIHATITEEPLAQLVMGRPFLVQNGISCQTQSRELSLPNGERYQETTGPSEFPTDLNKVKMGSDPHQENKYTEGTCPMTIEMPPWQPHLPIVRGDVHTHIIIDSGAEENLIAPGMVDFLNLQMTEPDHTCLYFIIGNISFRVEARICKGISHPIIGGIPFIREEQLIISTSSQTIAFRNGESYNYRRYEVQEI